MDDLKRLLAIEAIRQLKGRYCRLLDEKKMDEWREVFTPDALMIVPEGIRDPQEIYGAKAIVEFVGGLLQGTVCVHHIHGAEIEILSDNEATGIWAIDDTVLWPSEGPTPFGLKRIHIAGHYRDKFRRTDEGWRLSESRVTQVPLDQA
jgi:hypothetical protein